MGVTAVFVAELAELRPQAGYQVRIFGSDYSVWLLGDADGADAGPQIRVLDNACLHVGGPIADGAVKNGCVICPWHGWTYDLSNGARKTAFGDVAGLRVYASWLQGTEIWADLPGRE